MQSLPVKNKVLTIKNSVNSMTEFFIVNTLFFFSLFQQLLRQPGQQPAVRQWHVAAFHHVEH